MKKEKGSSFKSKSEYYSLKCLFFFSFALAFIENAKQFQIGSIRLSVNKILIISSFKVDSFLFYILSRFIINEWEIKKKGINSGVRCLRIELMFDKNSRSQRIDSKNEASSLAIQR
uniref:Uncharacterized protein n=1 Tax=Medinilla magnifica TaxID=1799599 RepID=A0A7D4V727_9MYRT|nr:hypothetical protein [Medinilla magnifica]QKS31801.1 hypothetical protein [Medinilla magnifica]